MSSIISLGVISLVETEYAKKRNTVELYRLPYHPSPNFPRSTNLHSLYAYRKFESSWEGKTAADQPDEHQQVLRSLRGAFGFILQRLNNSDKPIHRYGYHNVHCNIRNQKPPKAVQYTLKVNAP